MFLAYFLVIYEEKKGYAYKNIKNVDYHNSLLSNGLKA